MLFAITCLDKPGHAQVRAANRPRHIDYLKSHQERFTFAGPLLDDDAENVVGSLLVVDFADMGEARAFAAGDPYAEAGLFDSVAIRPVRKVLPA